jgi:Zn-dependent peptidase ImmA (M78 family)
MHNPLPASPDVHDEANRFAGAFLLPADALKQEITSATTLETFLSIKLKWGVSVQAAVVRAHELGLITPRKYRTLYQRLSQKGWRVHEPLSNRGPVREATRVSSDR